VLISAVAVLGASAFISPFEPAPTAPFAALGLGAAPSLNAFGVSQEVRLRFALPKTGVEFPIEVSGDPARLSYEWVEIRDSISREAPRPVNGASFVTPTTPGYYRLAIIRGIEREIIPAPTVAVMVPFEQKVKGRLNGYRIGTYLAERVGRHDHPAGFLEVRAEDAELRVSTHLRLGDFLTHDAQEDVWPKYVALNPKLLD